MTADITAAMLRGRPRLLGLGEPTHGDESLLRLRNELFRELVEVGGYRTVAVESDCLRGLIVDDYVTGGAGELDDVMARGFSHEWGAYAGNRDLVSWMRSFNEGRPDRVRFAGFDGPLEITAAASPRPVLTALHDYLAAHVDPGLLPGSAETLLGGDDQWVNPLAMRDPAQSVGRTAAARELRVLADDLVALLDMQAPGLPPEGLERARLYGRTATGLLRYHYWMADTSPARLTWLVSVRDAMMAANLVALASRGPTLVYAHNGHLQRAKSSMRMGELLQWWSAGAIAGARLDGEYAFFATAVGTLGRHGVGEPGADTVEGLLYARGRDRFAVDPGELAGAVARVSPWYGYAPLDPAHLADIDGIVFLKNGDR